LSSLLLAVSFDLATWLANAKAFRVKCFQIQSLRHDCSGDHQQSGQIEGHSQIEGIRGLPWKDGAGMAEQPERVRHFFTKIAGVSHRNQNGTERQAIITRCRVGEPLTLTHEEDNPKDPNAVRVCRADGSQLGYLNAGLAEQVVRRSAKGYRFAVFIKNLTGGTARATTRGVNLLIVQADPGVSDQEAQDYADRFLSDPRPGRAGCLGVVALLIAALAVMVLI
jgi:HIRAN domain